jgi:zinc transporter ZupT
VLLRYTPALIAAAFTVLATLLGIAGLAFFAYVNIRLLDYLMPVHYAALVVLSRRERHWFGAGFWAPGRPETLWLVLTHAITIWRTTALHKWERMHGRPW